MGTGHFPVSWTRRLIFFRRSLAAHAAFALFFIPLGPAPAPAANYALLIGVSNYTHKDITPLKGPANDVTLLWRVLGKRGFGNDHITVLADGLKTGAEFPRSTANPTRAAILDALSKLAQRAATDDLVLIYFSGHGTEQPVRKGSQQDPERGNLDQVMLPLDAGAFEQSRQSVRNGLIDNHFGDALDKIRERGADVWVIIDACHSGSMTRGPLDGLAVRGIEPSRLGVPAAPPSASSRILEGKNSQFTAKPVTAKPGFGSLVEFFAVDSSREAIERSFDEFEPPMVGEGRDRRMGVFTYFLYKALSDGSRQISTYRDLAHQLVQDMQQSRIAPPALPQFGGDLERPLLAIGKAPPPAAWRVKLEGNTVEVEGGALHGITENTVLRLSLSPAEDGAEWAQATVRRADPIRATAILDRPIASVPQQTIWARVAVPGVSFAVFVAEPPATELDGPTRRLIEETKAQASRMKQGAIDWVPAQHPAADVRLRAHGGRLWILPADAEWVREDFRQANPKLRAYPLTPSYPVASTTAVKSMVDALHAIARARNMIRLAEAADPSRGGTSAWDGIKVTAERLPSPGTDKNPQRACPDLARMSEQERKAAKPIDIKLPQPVFHCDLLRVSVLNTGQRDVDVNLSYVDAASGIAKLGQECTITVPPGGRLERSLWVTTWNRRTNAPDSIGREHIVVTAVERKGGVQANLCFIQDAVRGVDPGQRRGGAPGKAGWLLGALEQAALASSTTRGVEVAEERDAPDAARAGMYLVTLQVTPPVAP